MRSDMLSTFGGLFRNEQLMRLSELRLPFRLLVDFNHEHYDVGRDQWFRFQVRLQMALCTSAYECFKLRRSVLPTSTSTGKFEAAENVYMLETRDGKFLSVTESEKQSAANESTQIEFTVCDIP